ncbi:hypothetical protein Gotur_022806 [Gossypium turneri]
MGVAVSSPFAKPSDVKNGLQSVTVKSIPFDEDEAKTLVRSISYNSLEPESLILISVGSKKMVSEGSVSFKGLDLEQSVSAKSPPLDKPENVPIKAFIETPKRSPVFDPSNPQHEAAIRLQKVYKSFRTRRKLADCAIERKPYEVMVVDGKFVYKQTGKPVHTIEETGDAKWIFVLSTSKILYVGVKKKGTFQHSSFLAGGATIAAGILVVDNGILKAVWPHSGHYRPLEENFNDFISFLRENNVDLNNVKMTPVDEEGNLADKQRSNNHLRCNSSEDGFNFEADEISVKDSIDQIRCNNDNSMDSSLVDGYAIKEETVTSELDSYENHADNKVEDPS